MYTQQSGTTEMGGALMPRRDFLIGAAGVVGGLFLPGEVTVEAAGFDTSYLPRNHFIESAHTDVRQVAITVDDFSNWHNVTALNYLDGLIELGNSYNTIFTLFPIGQELDHQFDRNPRRTRRLWQQAIWDGHIIGNHTWSHPTNIAARPATRIASEMRRQQRSLNTVLGHSYRERLYRPPYGSGGFPHNPAGSPERQQYLHQIKVVKQLGYWMTMWSTDSNDARGRVRTPGNTDAEEDRRFLRKIFYGQNGDTSERVRNGSIILVHPSTLTLNGMEQLIRGLHRRNYDCVSVPELFAP